LACKETGGEVHLYIYATTVGTILGGGRRKGILSVGNPLIFFLSFRAGETAATPKGTNCI